MPLMDLQDLPPDQAFQADLVIIGAGVAGLILADALRGSGLNVDVLEVGGTAPEPGTL